uniref:UMOD/GP2/OIT3-like D8C domain-containing protein n=1 Tax=Poecilia formosa TaxID=48698 RepID=A0A096MC79_POEFO
DACVNYNVLNDSWRSTENTENTWHCDRYIYWSGWYRFYLGQTNAQIPEKCVGPQRCGTYGTLWINGTHPLQLNETVTRRVCDSWGGSCCYFPSHTIQIKRCYGYYIYKLQQPYTCYMAYCTATIKILVTNRTSAPLNAEGFMNITTNGVAECLDACVNYNVLNDAWRSTENTDYSWHCDRYITWSGWYRFYLGQTNAQIPEKCVAEIRCGTHAPLWINGAHPVQLNETVTRTVCNAWSGSCCLFPTHTIQIKRCYGYYVYKLQQPSTCWPKPIYCLLLRNTPCIDACVNNNVLNDAWRSTENTDYSILHCDYYTAWSGWYRFYLGQTSAQIPEKCVAERRCGTHATLWINGAHPVQLNETVTRTVCSTWSGSCCYFPTHTVQIKRCYGYYVYKLQQPYGCSMAYCTVSTENPLTFTPGPTHLSTTAQSTECITTNGVAECLDPCATYTVLNDAWRSTENTDYSALHCDYYIYWSGWYRFYLGQTSAQIPEKCIAENSCGAYGPMWITEPHPVQLNEIATRTVCNAWVDSCCLFPSHTIQIKRCYGYYVYKLQRPSACWVAYCTVYFKKLILDPCATHTVLNDAWRSTENTDFSALHCDQYIAWSGWYRFYLGQTSAQIPEKCIAERRCGTVAPLWINGTHPVQLNEIVTRTVCNAWVDSCCLFPTHTIQIKRCYGYYVYKLQQPSVCWTAYCTACHKH